MTENTRCWKQEWELIHSSAPADFVEEESALNELLLGISHCNFMKDPLEWTYAIRYCIHMISAEMHFFSQGKGEAFVSKAMEEVAAIICSCENPHDDRFIRIRDFIYKVYHLDAFWSHQPVVVAVPWVLLCDEADPDTSIDILSEMRRNLLQPYLGSGIRVGVLKNIECCLSDLFSMLSVHSVKHMRVLQQGLLCLLCIYAVNNQDRASDTQLYNAVRGCLARLTQHCVDIQTASVGLSELQVAAVPCVPALFVLEQQLQPQATRVIKHIINPSMMINELYTDTDLLRNVESDTLMRLLADCSGLVYLISDRLIHISLRSDNRIAQVLLILSKLLHQIQIHLVDVVEPTDTSFDLIQCWPELSSRLLHIFEGHVAEARVMSIVDALSTFVTALYEGVMQISLINEEFEDDLIVEETATSPAADVPPIDKGYMHNTMKNGNHVAEHIPAADIDVTPKVNIEVVDILSDDDSSGTSSDTADAIFKDKSFPVPAATAMPASTTKLDTSASSSALQRAAANVLPTSSRTEIIMSLSTSISTKRSLPIDDDSSAKRSRNEITQQPVTSVTEQPPESTGKVMKISGGANWLEKMMLEKRQEKDAKEAAKLLRQNKVKQPPGTSLRQRMHNEKHERRNLLLREDIDGESRDSSFVYDDFRRGRGAVRAADPEEYSMDNDPDALGLYGFRSAGHLDDEAIPAAAPTSRVPPAPRRPNLSALLRGSNEETTAVQTYSRSAGSAITVGHTFNNPIDAVSIRLKFCEFALSEIMNYASGQCEGSSESVDVKPVEQRFRDEDHYKEVFLPLVKEEVKSMLQESINNTSTVISHQRNNMNAQTNRQQRSRGGGSIASAIFEVLQPFPQEAVSNKLVSVRVKGFCPFEKDDLVIVSTVDIASGNVSLGELLSKQPTFAVVSRTSRADINESERCLILPLLQLPSPMTKWSCVYLTSLSTHLREYTAVQCIKSLGSMPLAPYILCSVPICSAELLNNVVSSIEICAQKLQRPQHSSSEEAIMSTLLMKMDFLQHHVQVDFSVLKATNAPKRLTKIKKALVRQRVTEAVAALKRKWEEMTKLYTLNTMIGGNLAMIPDGVACPQHISQAVWNKFRNRCNASQLYAINYVSKPLDSFQDTRIALVQGPPGCGKTWTIVGMISAMMQPSNGAGMNVKRLLVCAASNAAVDEVLCRLRKGIPTASGDNMLLRMIRIGKPIEGTGTDSAYIESITLDTQTEKEVEKHSLTKDLRRVNNDIVSLTAKFLKFSPAERLTPVCSDIRQQLQRLKHVKMRYEEDLGRVRAQARASLLSSAHIIGCTLSGAAHQHVQEFVENNHISFDAVLIDEAAQATEPACLIPLQYGAKTLVLVGDPRQLPAYVNSSLAQEKKLGMSLFERLEKANHEVVMLQVQYRMHPLIRKFPSAQFYANRLLDAEDITNEVKQFEESDRNETPPVKPACTRVVCDVVRRNTAGYLNPVTFFDLRSDEASVGTSFSNATEARFIASLVAYYKYCLIGYKIGIITAYRAQLRELKRSADLGDSNIEINTIDGFQGREKDIVIVSTVRSNSRGGIGFLADERRLNVALTRAKRCLIVVGNAAVLEANALWRNMLCSLPGGSVVRTPRSGDFNELPDIKLYDRAKQEIMKRLQGGNVHQY